MGESSSVMAMTCVGAGEGLVGLELSRTSDMRLRALRIVSG